MERNNARRARDMVAYTLYNLSVKRNNPFLSEAEVNSLLRMSRYEFPPDAKPEDITRSLEFAGLIRIIEGFGIEVLACPYIPKQALKRGDIQEGWFSGEMRNKLYKKSLNLFQNP